MNSTDVAGAEYIGEVRRYGGKATTIHREYDHGRCVEINQPDNGRIRAYLLCRIRDRQIKNDAACTCATSLWTLYVWSGLISFSDNVMSRMYRPHQCIANQGNC